MGADENRFRFNVNTRWRSKKYSGLSYGVNSNYNDETGNLFFLFQFFSDFYPVLITIFIYR